VQARCLHVAIERPKVVVQMPAPGKHLAREQLPTPERSLSAGCVMDRPIIQVHARPLKLWSARRDGGSQGALSICGKSCIRCALGFCRRILRDWVSQPRSKVLIVLHALLPIFCLGCKLIGCIGRSQLHHKEH